MLETRIECLCETLANSTGHMAISAGFINTLPNILKNIYETHTQDQTIGTENAMLFIEDSLKYICRTLDDASTLALIVHNEFNGDLNGAIEAETETQA